MVKTDLNKNITILLISGSTRLQSYNRKLIGIVEQEFINLNFAVKVIDLINYELPIYNGDYEDRYGIPTNAKKLKKLFKTSQGLFISTPEYNGGIPSLLKNTLDWISRKEKGENSLESFKGIVAGIVSASPGKRGGERALQKLRQQLQDLGVTVINKEFSLSQADSKFSKEEKLQIAGIFIKDAKISHLAYSPEIAVAMLRRQQAEAVLFARRRLVEGALGIVDDVLTHYKKQGINLSDEHRIELINNLLVTLTSDREANPIVNVGT